MIAVFDEGGLCGCIVCVCEINKGTSLAVARGEKSTILVWPRRGVRACTSAVAVLIFAWLFQVPEAFNFTVDILISGHLWQALA